MTQPTKDQNQKSGPAVPEQKEQAGNEQKQKAEQEEVAGRHKNQGKNDNAGHKTSH